MNIRALILCAPVVLLPFSLKANTFTVTLTGDIGTGSLRQAIIDANAHAGLDTIAFNIPGGGMHTIAPLTPLPTITDPVVIDGTTQPGFTGMPIIELNGSSAGSSASGLEITAGNCTVRGLVINRFSSWGIHVSVNGSNMIQGNFIGTDPTGTVALGNSLDGVSVENSGNNVIGGTTSAAANLLSGNGRDGLDINFSGATNNVVQGNLIGTDVSGTNVLGNGRTGVSIFFGAQTNIVGGTVLGARNVISGNGGDGIVIGNQNGFPNTTGNIVQGNFIGTDASGTLALGNRVDGINIFNGAASNTIGGTTVGAGNVILGNGYNGILITDSAAINNAILSNSIYDNGGLGIDLGGDGVTPNDPCDTDTGPNNLQNYPILTSVTNGGGNTSIAGRLNSAANTSYRIEFFANDAIDPSGFGEGQSFVGFTNATTDASCNVSFNVSVPQIAAGRQVTATATDPNGNTSEFSPAMGAVEPGPGDLFASINGTTQNGGGSIFQYTPAGTQSTLVSGLDRPRGVAFDSAGNLFVATNTFDPNSGTFQGTILKIAPDGTQSNFGSVSNNFFIEGVVTDSADNIFVDAQDQNFASTIFKFTPSGAQSTFGSVASQSYGPAFDSAGNLYVPDDQDQTIYKFTPAGTQSIFAGPSAFTSVQGPIGLAFDRFGNLFVSTEGNSGNPGGDAILKFTPDGTESTFATGLNYPRGLVFDSAGNLFAAEVPPTTTGDILKFTPDGTETVFASGLGRSQGNGGPEFLTFTPFPVITSPATATATQGQLFVYQVTATNNPTSFGATPLPPGLTLDTVHGILGGTPTDPGTTQIQLTASNSFGTGTATLTLTVQPAPPGPVIMSGTSLTARTGVPFSYEVFTTGGSSTARLTATGLPPGLSVDPVTGIISGIPTADGSFGVTLTVTDGAVTNTFTLELTFTSDPAIPVIISPRETTLAAGQFFTYTIVAPSSNQSGTTFSLIGTLPSGLVFDAATGTISGTYNSHFQNGGALLGNVQLIATNSSGTATSTLAFFQQVSGAAKNISTRLAVGTSDNVLIGGIIVTGNAPKKVIIRAIGPSLTQYNVPDALQDPTLELHDHTQAMIAFNDNWMDAPNRQAIIDSGLAPSNSLESAILTTLDPGNYTAIIRGTNDTTGNALVEVYDLGTASLDVSSSAQLGNISTRGLVQTGDNVMIGGFIVQGDMPATVIVRAIGPSLTAYGVPGALQDPTLELHDGTGAVIGSNDNWQDDPRAAQIQADNLAPSDPRESATIVPLNPGNYTAIVRGANGTTGVALVEAYVLP